MKEWRHGRRCLRRRRPWCRPARASGRQVNVTAMQPVSSWTPRAAAAACGCAAVPFHDATLSAQSPALRGLRDGPGVSGWHSGSGPVPGGACQDLRGGAGEHAPPHVPPWVLGRQARSLPQTQAATPAPLPVRSSPGEHACAGGGAPWCTACSSGPARGMHAGPPPRLVPRRPSGCATGSAPAAAAGGPGGREAEGGRARTRAEGVSTTAALQHGAAFRGAGMTGSMPLVASRPGAASPTVRRGRHQWQEHAAHPWGLPLAPGLGTARRSRFSKCRCGRRAQSAGARSTSNRAG